MQIKSPPIVRWLIAGLLAMALASPAQALPSWSRADAEALLEVVEGIAADGLDPADYNVETLRRDVAGWDTGWEARATGVFLHLAADLYSGHVRNRSAVGWYIAGPVMSDEERLRLLDDALSRHDVDETLQSLAPKHSQYTLLRAALAATPASDRATRQRLRANLERWRWMPRDLGARYLLVNVPAFTVTRFEGGEPVSDRRVIVGKRATPTPQFSATVTGVIFNPWWDVPDSIARESVAKLVRTQPAVARQRGYLVQNGRIRQRPGPGNALGQAKLVMANAYRVYLHDTPNRELFAQTVRGFSHGCIRTQDIIGLAAELIAGTPGWERADIDRALAAGGTVQANLDRPLPVYVGYFTATVKDDGMLTQFDDLYQRDKAVVAQLVDRELN